jgi:hypothetical protein
MWSANAIHIRRASGDSGSFRGESSLRVPDAIGIGRSRILSSRAP